MGWKSVMLLKTLCAATTSVVRGTHYKIHIIFLLIRPGSESWIKINDDNNLYAIKFGALLLVQMLHIDEIMFESFISPIAHTLSFLFVSFFHCCYRIVYLVPSMFYAKVYPVSGACLRLSEHTLEWNIQDCSYKLDISVRLYVCIMYLYIHKYIQCRECYGSFRADVFTASFRMWSSICRSAEEPISIKHVYNVAWIAKRSGQLKWRGIESN